MRVLIAADSFKGSASAAEVGGALCNGWRSARPRDRVEVVPMADGGEGTLDALMRAAPGTQRHERTVTGPDGRPVRACWAMLPDGTAVVELASASGLALMDRPRPLEASTRGFGELIAAAIDGGAARLRLAIGGSASTDGGAGLLSALGARFLDARGAVLADGGGPLEGVARADLSALRPLPPGGVQVLTDVTNPLLGPRGAAAVYGPQKGATPEDVARLERALAALAGVLPADAATPGSGAAGGAALGLLAWGAQLVPGAAAVAAATGLGEAVAAAELVITGEGRFDAQSSDGKVPLHVAALAAAAGVPVLLVAGAIDATTEAFADAVSLTDLVGREAALADAPAALHRAAATLAARR